MQQWARGDSEFKPIVDPAKVSATTPSHLPTAMPLIQSKPKSNIFQRPRPPITYEDSAFSESKRYIPKVVRYTKRRDPPVITPKRTVKRYHTRPRRRPKPSYGPPHIPTNPLNEYSLAGDIYDPAMYKFSGSKKSSAEKNAVPPGIVDTDIGKFYDATATFSASNFKTPYKPFGTSVLSPTSLFGSTNDYKLGEPNPVLTNSDISSSGTYPASQSNFDASNFNLYETQPQTIYPTAPQLPQTNALPSHIQSQLTLGSNSLLKGNLGTLPKPKKTLPPSTSYGVPVAPNLSSYALESTKNSYQIPLQATMPTGPNFDSNNFKLDPNSVSLTNPVQTNFGENFPGSSGNTLRQGNFAEPPNIFGSQQSEGVIDNFQSDQQGQFETDFSSYDGPFQFQQTKINSRPPRVRTITQSSFNANNIPDYEDGQVESSTNTGNFAQPVLPNTYDQEEFEAFARQKQKILRQKQRQQQEFTRLEDFVPSFDSSEENVRPVKKAKKRPTAKAPLPKPTTTPPPPPPPVEIEEDEDVEETPDEDYIDEIINRPTKPPVRYRKTKKRVRTTSTPHILDTDDLRDAFSSGSVKFSMAVKPDDMGTPMPRHKSQKTPKSSVNRKKPQTTYEGDMAPQVRAAQRPHDQTDRFDIISIRNLHSQTYFDPTVSPPTWQAIPNGIQSRYDQHFNFPNDVGHPVSQQPASSHNFDLTFKHNMNNHNYESNPDRSDTFVHSDVQSDNAIGTVNEEDNTERTLTSHATIRTTLWDGKILPKNHKMA